MSRVMRVALLALGLGLVIGCTAAQRRPAWELPPPPAPDARVVPEGALTRGELPNGMRVLVLQAAESQTYQCL
jgi:hypothetical protein